MAGENSQTNRRKVLKGIGIGSGLASFPEMRAARRIPTAGSVNNTVKVPHIIKQNEVIKWREVPQSWHEHIKSYKKSVKRSQDEYLSREGVLRISGVRWDKQFGGKNGLQIKFDIHPDQFEGDIPESVDGIPVVKNETREEFETVDCDNLGSFNPTPGGVTIEGAGGRGTSFAKVETSSNNVGLMTAYHVIGGDCGYNISGDAADQNCTKWGNVIDYDDDVDYAVIEPDSSFDAEGKIREPDGTEYEIAGHYSESTVCDFAANATYLRKVGTTTGLHEGRVQACHVQRSSCPSLNNHGVRTSIETVNGDSGGPVYRLDDSFSPGTACVIVNHTVVGAGERTCIEYTDSCISCDSSSCVSEGEHDEYPEVAGTAFYRLSSNHGLSLK